MVDRGQLARRECLVWRSYAAHPKTQALSKVRKGEEICAVMVKSDLVGQVSVVDRTTVIRSYGRNCSESAIIVASLSYDG
jgi:hypothetical protein